MCMQVQSWTYSARTRTIRAAARGARDAGVRVRELAPEELTYELRARLLHDVTGGSFKPALHHHNQTVRVTVYFRLALIEWDSCCRLWLSVPCEQHGR